MYIKERKGEILYMLCSVCHKNMAVIFTKKIDGENSKMEGYCYSCAKEKGINPLEVLVQQAGLTDEQLDNMSNQFESMLNEISLYQYVVSL